MAYVDETYYLEVYKGESVNGFPYLADRASEIIEEQTMYRLRKETFEQMPEALQTAIKKAVCAQIEHLDQLGGTEAESSMLASGSLGKNSHFQAHRKQNRRSVHRKHCVCCILQVCCTGGMDDEGDP